MATTSMFELINGVGSGVLPGLGLIRRHSDSLLASELSAEQRLSLSEIEQVAISMQGLFVDLQDLAAIESGDLKLADSEFRLSETVRESIRVMRPNAVDRGVELSATGLRSLPVLVRGDPSRLRQVLNHLVANAIAATASGTVSVMVSVVAESETSVRILIEVEDTGCGIASGDLERIFEPFQQVARGFSTGGAGLGLTVSNKLVTAMGGRLNVRSQVDAGTVFSFELDLSKPEVQTTAVEAPVGPGWILLISDTAGSHEAIGNILERNDHTVTVHATPERAATALALADGDMPDVIVITPGPRPFEVAARVMALPVVSRIPILLVVADGTRGEAIRCEELGIDGYLTQPASAVDLCEAIDLFRSRDRGGSLVTKHLLRERRTTRKILLVDASPTRRAALIRQLEPLGHQVDVAFDAPSGLEAARMESHDVIVIDEDLTGLGGLGLARAIRATNHEIRLVATVPFNRIEEVEARISAGFDAWVPRTAAIEALHRTLTS